jgi:hypothetical protein
MPVYVVDGNNLEAYLAESGVLRSGEDAQLLLWLRRWLAGRRRKRGKSPRVMVFFDPGAAGKRLSGGEGLVVKVAPPGMAADDLILRELSRLPKKTGKRDAVLVTSDRALAEQAQGLGVEVMDCAAFADRVAPPLPPKLQEGPAEKAKIARELGHSLDEYFLPEKARGGAATRKIPRVSPRKVSELRDPTRLTQLMREGDRMIRRRAALALAHVGTEAARQWLEQAVVSDPVPSVRAAAARALGRMAAPDSIPSLRAAAQDPFALVRESVAHALSAYDAVEAREILLKLRDDPKRRVRRAAELPGFKGK